MTEELNQPIDLAAYDDDFATTEAAKPQSLDELPNGNYRFFVERAELKQTKGNATTGKPAQPYLNLQLRVIEPANFRSRVDFKSCFFAGESMKFTKADLDCLGIQITKLSELPGRLPDMLDVVIDGTVRNTPRKDDKTKNNHNIYMNKRVEAPIPDDARGKFKDVDAADMGTSGEESLQAF
jgi:hypothetical protein